MALEHAGDMPQCRSKLLRYLESGDAVSDWAAAAAASPWLPPPHVPREPGHTFIRRVARFTRDLIGAADLWWVHEDMTRLAVEAGKSLPRFRCHPGMLPSPVGLMAWATPVHVTHSELLGAEFRARAVAWLADDDGVWLISYDDTGDMPNPMGVGRLSTRLGWLSESVSIYLPWRDELEFKFSDSPARNEVHNASSAQCAVATWLLIGQSLATVTAAPDPRPVDARRLRRRGHPASSARIVSVTAATHPPAAVGAAGREYLHRWLVSGHWRQQPWGPGGRYRRPKWIEPHMKGPDGAPLLHTERVFTARSTR